MTRFCAYACAVMLLVSGLPITFAQQSSASIPALVNFSGVLTDNTGKPLTNVVGVTFSLYKDQQGGSPLWIETQNLQPDKAGHYSVTLGATTSQGLPGDLFSSGEARWLCVQAQGQSEQPRVMLLSVPYAMKAGDAATVGGLPPSAFVLAAPSGSAMLSSESSNSQNSLPTIGGSGTQNYIPIWTDSSGDLGNSILYQLGTGPSAKIGINEKSPLTTLDVNGTGLMRGLFEMATMGYATRTKGSNSNPLNFESSAFNSTAGTYTLEHFQWQSEPTGNNTGTPSATLNLLFAEGTNNPAETGLNIAANGQIAFASGQSFPGTVAGVTAGAGLTGGGNSGDVTLSVANNGVTNAMLQSSSLTVNPGGGMTGGGQISLGGTATLGLQNCGASQLLEFTGAAWVCTSAALGTITGVTAGAGLSGGGTSGNVSLSVPNSGITNTMLQNSTVTVNAGAGLSGGGAVALGGSTTLSLNSSQIPFLNTNNNFTGNQSASVNSLTAAISGTNSYTITSLQQVPLGISGLATGGTQAVGAGVYGASVGASSEGQNTILNLENRSLFPSIGAWGDAAGFSLPEGEVQLPIGLLGTVDAGYGVAGYNNSSIIPTAYFENDGGGPGTPILQTSGPKAGGGSCSIDGGGNLACTGTASPIVPVDNGSRKVALYAVESPENWFEDFGSGRLSSGSAIIILEPTFAQTINTDVEYHVFLTPNGDSRGLYVAGKTSTAFEVREQSGGTSNIAFDYRIVARRKGYENVRLADKTDAFQRLTDGHGKQVAARQHE